MPTAPHASSARPGPIPVPPPRLLAQTLVPLPVVPKAGGIVQTWPDTGKHPEHHAPVIKQALTSSQDMLSVSSDEPPAASPLPDVQSFQVSVLLHLSAPLELPPRPGRSTRDGR